ERIPGENIAGHHIPNDELRHYYRGAAWALNDHWPDMRERGFVSNRIFDVLASGGRLLTDDVEGLDGLFPESVLPHGVATFRSPAELLELAQSDPAMHSGEETLAIASAHVREHHTFEARASVMLDDVLALRASRGNTA
ncbi:MAG: glycosyltransferase family protein, partial [Pseudoclavibacter sp.]